MVVMSRLSSLVFPRRAARASASAALAVSNTYPPGATQRSSSSEPPNPIRTSVVMPANMPRWVDKRARSPRLGRPRLLSAHLFRSPYQCLRCSRTDGKGAALPTTGDSLGERSGGHALRRTLFRSARDRRRWRWREGVRSREPAGS
eukprot:3531425-Pyramimonas_sp.AAC.1